MIKRMVIMTGATFLLMAAVAALLERLLGDRQDSDLVRKKPAAQ
jgi:hypothetical protein